MQILLQSYLKVNLIKHKEILPIKCIESISFLIAGKKHFFGSAFFNELPDNK